jgi:hypothetical protein
MTLITLYLHMDGMWESAINHSVCPVKETLASPIYFFSMCPDPQQNQQAQKLINHKQNTPQDHWLLEMVPAVMHVFLAPL